MSHLNTGEALAPNTLPIHDPEQMGVLLESLKPKLTSVALRVTRDSAAADDVVQNAFEKVLRNGHQFQGNSKVGTWIHRIVTNEALMWLRSRRSRPALSLQVEGMEHEAIDPSPNQTDLLAGQQLEGQLQDGLNRLRPDEREVLQLFVFEGKSYQEVSKSTGAHPAALKTRLYRARQNLLHFLQQMQALPVPSA